MECDLKAQHLVTLLCAFLFCSGCIDYPPQETFRLERDKIYRIYITPEDEEETITVGFEWDPPTTNADGTLLTDLEGYKLYVDDEVRATTNGTSVNVLIPVGNHRVYVTAIDHSGDESGPSNVVEVP